MRRSGNRFSANAMSAISTKGRMHFMVFTESFTTEVMCRFLDRLAGHFDRKVHLMVRQHRTRNQAELAAETRRFFRRRQRQPHIVRDYFGGPAVRYVLDENPISFQDPDHARTSRPQLVAIGAVFAGRTAPEPCTTSRRRTCWALCRCD
ncbi:hypothetical protein ACIGZH_15855 [Streptomyces sp. NPDC058319]|uniref:hypothetical protein n=1 Tax=unclassified Streptomyces TaxID=2593676 RepID=UPI0036EE8BDB